jgi:pimeloyl-ACP methyl ester carboxylesterase
MGDKKTDVALFVHGIGASQETWWGTTPGALMTDPQLRHIEFDFFRYESSKSADRSWFVHPWFTRRKLAGLEDLGALLWDRLLDHAGNPNFSSIALFGHSMGGLVIAAAIVDGFRREDSERARQVRGMIKIIGLCATPLGGADIAAFANRLIKVLGPNPQMSDLRRISPTRLTIVAQLQNYTSLGAVKEGSDRVALQFFRVGSDTVVASDEERYGPFAKSVQWSGEAIAGALVGGHSECVKDLSPDKENYRKIAGWLIRYLPSKIDAMHTVPKPEEPRDEFVTLIEELQAQLWVNGVFGAWRAPKSYLDDASDTYLLRLFLQNLLYTVTKIHDQTVGSANVWVCHELEGEGAGAKPRSLRSEEREGHFEIGQLVVLAGNTVRYRPNQITFEPSRSRELSVAAQAIVAERPVFSPTQGVSYDSQAERGRGITHILGIPLFKVSDKSRLMLEGTPLAITIDFTFPKAPTDSESDVIDKRAKAVISLFSEFAERWKGRTSLALSTNDLTTL